jgi:hypothetical protein
VSLGYEPQWVLFKNSAATGSWRIYDSMRGIATGGVDAVLYPNLSAAEDTGSDSIDLTSTGFLVKGLSASNAHIYIAIRRGPMKVPTSGTSVYQSATRTGSASVIPRYVAGFPVDWTFRKSDVTAVGDWQAGDRLRGAVQVKPNLTEAETAASPLYIFDSMTGYSSLAATTNSTNDRSWMFRRAPSFFDEVCYTGTGSLTGVTHNLGVTPELKIIKRRNSTTDWVVGGSIIGENGYLFLNTTAAFTSSSNYWDGGDDSATVFSVRNTNSMSDASGGTYVAYLFATCAGVSKVGSYTGTGTTLQIDCGFTAGARFVLIKRTNSTGDWYVWDSARGIIAGNDPYLLLNSTAAEVTSTDYIDTYSAGFELSSTAPAAINASGGTFIFLAIA